MAELAKAKVTECPVCLDDYKDPRMLTACGHSVCAGCVQDLIDASPSHITIVCPECSVLLRVPSNGFPKNFGLSHVISQMQAGIACSSCQRKAPLEDLFRCETCRTGFPIDKDQDDVLCGCCAMKHSMASKTHEIVEHRMASERDIEKAIKRIDHKLPANRTYMISVKAQGTEYFAKEAVEAARKCKARSEEIRDGLCEMNDLTRDELERMTSKALRLKDVIKENQVAVQHALSVCNDAIAAEIEKCNRALQESNDVRADKANGPNNADPVPGTSSDSTAPSSSNASRVARKRKIKAEETSSFYQNFEDTGIFNEYLEEPDSFVDSEETGSSNDSSEWSGSSNESSD
ncbi:Tripartite motif-containing protein 45 [Aphelenchoides avenae]|nr:Tripartite motif-containing protein 45 [Aphelenchus avenae]